MANFPAPGWLAKEVSFLREKVEVRARNSEKSGWRKALNIRSTQQVSGLPGSIPGDIVWEKKQFRVGYSWKSILPIPASGVSLHPRDDRSVFLLCGQPSDCTHGAAALKMKFSNLAEEIKGSFGLKTGYSEDFIYGQFYKTDDGAHTFVRLLPGKVEALDPAVLDLLRARQILRCLPFVFQGLDILADLLVGKVHGPKDKVRARYVNAWRHALAMGRACEEFWADDAIPGWQGVHTELARNAKLDPAALSQKLAALVPDKDGKWTVQGVKKAAAVVARAFFGVQGICLRIWGADYLGQLGITLHQSGKDEEYRFAVDEAGRARFKNYLDKCMAVRQRDSGAAKNGDQAFKDALAGMLKEAVTDIEVLEIAGMNLAYMAFEPGFSFEVPGEMEKTLHSDMPDLKGTWALKHRFAQPANDPDYPGFVVSIYQRGSDFWIVPKGTSGDDGNAKLDVRTRDQADKKNGVSTGVEADGDPSGCAYHAVKKFKKPFLAKLKELGASPASKVIVTGHSLGGALTERLHLKLYEAGYKDTFSLAFSPPGLDARSISKALFRDEALGPVAFDRIAASGGTWDGVTMGGATGSCIPLRISCIRPWAPGTFTPVPFSVVGDNTADQRFLQHGTMFQHEARYAGFALMQTRQAGDRVKEDCDSSYEVYDYCKDVTKSLANAAAKPALLELIMKPDHAEHATRVGFSKAPATDAEREQHGPVGNFEKLVLLLVQEDTVPASQRKELEAQVRAVARKSNLGVNFQYVSAGDLQKKLHDATWAKGCIINVGAHQKELFDALHEGKIPLVQVHPAGWTLTGQGANEPHHVSGDGLAPYSQAMEWLATKV